MLRKEHLLDSDKSRIEKEELALKIIEEFKFFVLTYPGMAQIQNVEPTFKKSFGLAYPFGAKRHNMMRHYDLPSFDKKHYEALKGSSTKDRIGKGKDAELPGGMTLRQRPRKSVIKTDMSFGSEWIRKSTNIGFV
ncbi:hypothetical protein IV203_009619 [Nitzschia inconspicua]|uniref:Uncharacterized protein n=1 Tax=Nitzschia inconspicua TaxID=303405 RepID=A0A9K3KVR7_9STRA|nr:hypothetical protein IV203_009619 [Nitzschia inconspicua]